MKLATLVLEDGTVIEGLAFGAEADAVFELVFNTSMTGYQEILTDPSYRGQAVLFTVPHIGNVGINLEDDESARPQVAAAVIRSLSPVVSNWRSALSLSDWLALHGVPGISGVDTRWLTRKLRDGGTQKSALSTKGTPADVLLQMARGWPGLDGRDMVKEVTCKEPYHWQGDQGDKWVKAASNEQSSAGSRTWKVVAYDFGIKENILRHLSSHGAKVTVVPADTSADEVLAMKPDGVFLSNGPGDPAGLPYAVRAVSELIESGVPIFGICLGHQLIGRALGAETHRLKFGHHGGNHPVQYLPGGEVLITAQNHNYYVSTDDLDANEVEITYKSLNDDSLEGLRMKNKPVFSVQFHPEAAPGPHDAHTIFGEFFKSIRMKAAGTLNSSFIIRTEHSSFPYEA
ncbi:MAG TPA: glutamine-hydrolyzing carbamoyl-phosphate synthase small subunit [Anaerolineales bacterium]|nr:glutamine-hydrolyzing carbamoyl-phosphate synthase small subunit [Anaerolineales bacterium]